MHKYSGPRGSPWCAPSADCIIIIIIIILLLLYYFHHHHLLQHEQYNTGTASYANDIAILTLQTLITLGGNVGVATLPPNNNDQFVGANCVITGWGRNCESVFLLSL